MLDYDHLREKSFGITKAVWQRRDFKLLRAELAKCQLVCVNCHRTLSQTRLKTRSARNEKRRRMKRPDILLLRALKEMAPCADCDRRFPYWVMDFDHVGEKTFALRDLGNKARPTLSELLDELRRCEVVCANCHRLRTFVRRYQAGDRATVATWTRLGMALPALARRLA